MGFGDIDRADDFGACCLFFFVGWLLSWWLSWWIGLVCLCERGTGVCAACDTFFFAGG